MKKIWLIIPLVVAIAIAASLLTRVPGTNPKSEITTTSEVLSPTPQIVDITAGFEIYTLGTKRIFTSSKYHNLSTDVYISASDPSQVHVKKAGITWADFFKTLPMKLTKDCLTTGTGQTFCTNNSQKLKFFINNSEDPGALDKEIKEADKLKVVYE